MGARAASRPPPEPPLRGEFATVDAAMRAAAVQFADREAYVDGPERVTFAEWVGRAEAIATQFAALGVRRGDVVALLLPSSIDYATCYAAAALLGAVTSGINPRLGPRETAAILERSAPALLVHDPALPLPDDAPDAPVLARPALDPGTAPPGRLPDGERPDPADPVVIIWTSGTTGTPKGAWFDHRNLAAAVRSAGVLAAPYDRRIVSTPMPHAGYMAKLWEQLAWGITCVLGPTPWTADGMLRLLAGERITVGGGVPTQWAKLLEEPALSGADLGALRLCVSATAPAPPELVERMTARLGCPVVVRYAMTESPSITGTAPGDDPEVLFRTVGRPQDGVEVVVADEHGEPVGAGAVGRVRVRGECVMRGYWREPDLTAEVLSPDGWLTSGDLARWDPAGNLVLVGRVSDLYIRGGYNVYPLEVENVLAEHPQVARVAVVGVPAPVIGEIGVAVVVPENGAQPPDLEDLRTWARNRLADYKAPDELVLVDDLPVTSMLKVDKATLRARLEAQGVGRARQGR